MVKLVTSLLILTKGETQGKKDKEEKYEDLSLNPVEAYKEKPLTIIDAKSDNQSDKILEAGDEAYKYMKNQKLKKRKTTCYQKVPVPALDAEIAKWLFILQIILEWILKN